MFELLYLQKTSSRSYTQLIIHTTNYFKMKKLLLVATFVAAMLLSASCTKDTPYGNVPIDEIPLKSAPIDIIPNVPEPEIPL